MIKNVLIIGGGGPAAIGAIKSLRKANEVNIIAVDSNPLSAGLFLADKKYVIPKANEKNHWEALEKIISEEKIDLILPSGNFDLEDISKNKEELEKKGIIVFMSDLEVIENCKDKWKFYQINKDKFDLPKTSLNHKEIGFPTFAKPRSGKGSVGAFLIKNEEDLKKLLDEEYVFQEYLPGEELTIDVVSNLEGESLVAVPRIRVEVKAGISSKGKIIRDAQIEKMCLDIAKHMKLKGPTCMQIKYDKDNKPKFVEINPRLGGGTYFATKAGVNIPQIILDMANNKKISIPKAKEITIIRYYEEIVVEEGE